MIIKKAMLCGRSILLQSVIVSVFLLLLPSTIHCKVVCGDVECSADQSCCSDKGTISCCAKSSPTSSLAVTVGVLFLVCCTATGLGICLYFKKRVHRDTAYNADDIEDMYVTSLYKEMKRKVESIPSNKSAEFTTMSRDGLMTSRENVMTSRENLMMSRGGTPGLICEDIPTITPGRQHTEMAVMPSVMSNYSLPGSVMTSRDGVMTSRDNLMASRQNSVGTINTISTADKMTESVETQVTSAKRTVVTVNLNMKEKENIKLNIFMNKDKADAITEEVESNASFPRGLSAKLAKKKAGKRPSSSLAVEKKESLAKKDSRTRSKSPAVTSKTSLKEKLSKKPSAAKKKKT